MADSPVTIASIDKNTFIARLPNYQITLKTIDVNDSVVGGTNSSNQNFKELEKLLTIFNDAIKELSNSIDLDNITNETIIKLETSKKMFPLHYGLSEFAEPEQVTYFDRIYDITRIDDRTFKITRFIGLDTVGWDTSRIISQVKDNDGIISNVMITTRENAIIVRFQDVPETDHFLYII